MVVLILTTVGMIRLETARNALESDFAEAMSLASSARLAEALQHAMRSIRAIRTTPDRPGVDRELEFIMALPIRVRIALVHDRGQIGDNDRPRCGILHVFYRVVSGWKDIF